MRFGQHSRSIWQGHWGLTQFPAKEQGAFATCPMFSWGSKQFGLCLICLESEDAAYQLLTRLPGEFGGHIASPNMPEAWRISGLVWISIVVNQLEYVLSHCSGNFNCCTKRINKQLAPPPFSLFPRPPAHANMLAYPKGSHGSLLLSAGQGGGIQPLAFRAVYLHVRGAIGGPASRRS